MICVICFNINNSIVYIIIILLCLLILFFTKMQMMFLIWTKGQYDYRRASKYKCSSIKIWLSKLIIHKKFKIIFKKQINKHIFYILCLSYRDELLEVFAYFFKKLWHKEPVYISENNTYLMFDIPHQLNSNDLICHCFVSVNMKRGIITIE